MPKKKKAVKKSVKKSAKKSVKKKTTKKHDPLKQIKPIGLHAKKLLIMQAVPVLPCSAVSKDRQGLMYAHSQAAKVFYTYSQECQKYGLTIRMIECDMSTAKYPIDRKTEAGWSIEYIECSRAVCKFRITDKESGEYEDFMASGLGDNTIWSDTSACTVAMKEALLLYFMTSWPQPTNMIKIIKDELKSLDGRDLVKAIEKIMPPKAYEILTEAGAMEELRKFFGDE